MQVPFICDHITDEPPFISQGGGVTEHTAAADIQYAITANCCIAGLMTVKHCQVSAVLQQHIAGTPPGNTELTLSIGAINKRVCVSANGTAAVLSNCNSAPSREHHQRTTAMNGSTSSAAAVVNSL